MLGGWGKRMGGGSVDTLVGGRALMRGEVVFAGGLYVDGRIVGRVLAEEGEEATLTVSKHAHIEGQIHAPVVVINGEVHGDVHAAKRLELGPNARIHGNLYYRVLVMTAGAAVSGQLVHEEIGTDRAGG